ncbi:hypothetical protein K5X82_16075 [Halosquirtibacter xylanolyticus]|uniref:chondroitinase family polysaccharide lyase n=1 Tax=Halosquirtibacter xylanolyticus TaxID=3374599 RepID=UPI0037498FE1|nr:hypothetical protein K5X82_16075 [Prolixibacteraceae bacterium]
MNRLLIITLLTLITSVTYGATYRMNIKYIGLDGKKVPTQWVASSGSKMKMDKSRYKLGRRSLRWDYASNKDQIVYTNPELITQALEEYKGGFMTWVYNSKPQNDSIKIEFLDQNKTKFHFYYHLNFKGWRACWIRFKEDMTGDKSTTKLEKMIIHAPSKNSTGTLWFDRMAFPKRRIHDRVTPDQQLPWINPTMNENHWAALYHWESTYECDIKVDGELSERQKNELTEIYQRTLKYSKGSKPSAKQLENALDKMDLWGIKRSKDSYIGTPFVSFDESSPEEIIIQDAGKILNTFANDYYHNKNLASAQNFELLLSYLIDQGLAFGSGIGTNHHYGYQFTLYPRAIFLMTNYLTRKGKIDQIGKMLCYWTGLQEMRTIPEIGSLQGVVDSWHTTVLPRIIAAGTIKNAKERYIAYKMIERWMDQSLCIVPGTMGGIKEDGTMFHHGANYPAYSVGGLFGIGEYVHMMHNTEFQLNKNSRINVARCLENLFHSTNKTYWGLGIAGRHPLGGRLNKGTIKLYGQIAMLGNPYNPEEKIWKEIASMYLDVEPNDTPVKKKMVKDGIKPYEYKGGNFYTYNYNCLATVDHKNWLATIKGYNQDVWCSEIYVKDNRFGRYQSYGTVQILSNGLKGSGFEEKGWDWNRAPGATSIHLPLEELESFRKGVLMQRSNETFAGSANLNHQIGVFGTILQENNMPRFTPSFRAMKSVFYFDNMLVCLGNNIQNDNKKYPTETTIFQVKGKEKIKTKSNIALQNGALSGVKWVKDPFNNGYIFPNNTNLLFENKEQTSMHNKSMKTTKGRFSSLVINHGKAPKGASYQYVIVPQTNDNKLKSISSQFANNRAPYTVLRNDSTVSAIKTAKHEAYMYAFYHAATLKQGPVLSSSDESLVIFKANNEHATLVVTDPSIHLPNRKMIHDTESEKQTVTVIIDGKWKLSGKKSEAVKQITNDDNKTSFEVICWKGRNNTIKLHKF